jgi:hypothetical protein
MLAERSQMVTSREWWRDDEVILIEFLYRHHVDFSDKMAG